jgi:hypothetical protein
MTDNGGAGHTHATQALTGWAPGLDGQAIGMLQPDADIVLAKGLQAQMVCLVGGIAYQIFKIHGADALSFFVKPFYNDCTH